MLWVCRRSLAAAEQFGDQAAAAAAAAAVLVIVTIVAVLIVVLHVVLVTSRHAPLVVSLVTALRIKQLFEPAAV
jgi:hypothetical protein